MSKSILFYKIFFFLVTHGLSSSSSSSSSSTSSLWNSPSREPCSRNLKYLYGDAFNDDRNCLGPDGSAYPTELIERTFSKSDRLGNHLPNSRRARVLPRQTLDPGAVHKTLLKSFATANDHEGNFRTGKSAVRNENSCPTPARLCKTRYNTTAPMYGVSLTSGQPVTIVQKFPDLLQQVVFEVCESSECDVVRGECTQTYVPYLFLVIPLGPVTLTGQDYVLVESGCTCRPKYSNSAAPSPVSAVPTA